MEEQIKRTAGYVKAAYISFWVLAAACVLLGETDGDWVGMYADCIRDTYLAETLTILLTAVCVPVSLKLFSWMLEKKIDRLTLPSALRLYLYGCIGRLVLLFVPVLAGMLVYYFMLSTKGMLCALIALTASLFCLPGEERLRKDLCIDRKGEERG